jgi:putative ABC transport system substrate-binding protein
MTRLAVALLYLSLLATPLAVEAQPVGNVWRIGVVLSRYAPAQDPPQAFRQHLRDLGYVEGQNVTIEWRHAERGYERLPELAAELVRLKADVIVADVALATRAAMRATPTIPIVMALAADPVGDGLVSSLARPGGNVTGISLMLPEISTKRLQLLKDALPKVSRVAVLWHPTTPWHKAMLQEIETVAPSLGLQLVPIAVPDPGGFEGAFSAMARERVGGAFVGDNPVFSSYRTQLLDLAAKSRLPMIFSSRDWAAAGGLMSYGASYSDMFRRAAVYVDKILKGAKPAELPIEQPTKFELVVNLKTAKALGLTIPQAVLLRADQVIQ